MSQKQGQIQSWALGEGAIAPFYNLFHVRNFLILLFAIGNTTIWEDPWPSLDLPLAQKEEGAQASL